ncbi:hypothetical protein QTN94_19570 [Vibrio sp. M250220]|uniref:hypothetical protein n=1 Tax=Vibrio sp. M250220 TaxID=3020894 RepID=UPI002F3F2536
MLKFSLMILIASVSFGVNAHPNKEILKGFITRGDVSKSIGNRNGFDNPFENSNKPQDWAKYVDGVVLQVEWSTLEPRDDEYNFEIIKNALNTLREYNKENGTNLGLKLRVFAGQYSPRHILNNPNIGSTYVSYSSSNDRKGRMANFWVSTFMDEYVELHKELAKEFDSTSTENRARNNRNAILREVSITACMMKSADMHRAEDGDNYLDRERDNKTNIGALMAAGLTFESDFDCQLDQISKTADIWKNTWVSVARAHFNDYSNHSGIKPKSGERMNENWPLAVSKMKQIVNKCRSYSNCIIGNNSLEYKETRNNNAAFFDPSNAVYYVSQKYNLRGDNVGLRKAPIYFQTVVSVQKYPDENKSKIHNVINKALDATNIVMIELPTLSALKKYNSNYLRSQSMQDVRMRLKNN